MGFIYCEYTVSWDEEVSETMLEYISTDLTLYFANRHCYCSNIHVNKLKVRNLQLSFNFKVKAVINKNKCC